MNAKELEPTINSTLGDMLAPAVPFVIAGIVLAVIGGLLAKKWRHRDYIARPLTWFAWLIIPVSVIVGLIVGWVSYTFF